MLREWMKTLRQRSKQEEIPLLDKGRKTAKGVSERDVDRTVRERELANFWSYDGEEQIPVSREDILRQIN